MLLSDRYKEGEVMVASHVYTPDRALPNEPITALEVYVKPDTEFILLLRAFPAGSIIMTVSVNGTVVPIVDWWSPTIHVSVTLDPIGRMGLGLSLLTIT